MSWVVAFCLSQSSFDLRSILGQPVCALTLISRYHDRIALYELYHHLNHHALFGGGYRSGAMSMMKDLIGKYGQDGGGKGEL